MADHECATCLFWDGDNCKQGAGRTSRNARCVYPMSRWANKFAGQGREMGYLGGFQVVHEAPKGTVGFKTHSGEVVSFPKSKGKKDAKGKTSKK